MVAVCTFQLEDSQYCPTLGPCLLNCSRLVNQTKELVKFCTDACKSLDWVDRNTKSVEKMY
jgi:hypothetical protein